MKPLKMINSVQKYSWGSPDFIPDLLGVDKDGKPWAEMWMGDHLRAPSLVRYMSEDISLRKFIKEHPEEVLGSDYSRFGEKLPFLFKVLSAESPLSLQAHPDRKTAETGFKEENRTGIPLDAYNRNYKDNNHKPEIICALTPFTAMCGFLSAERIESNFRKLDSSVFGEFIEPSFEKNSSSRLESFFRSLMVLKADDLNKLIEAAVKWSKSSDSIESELILKFAGIYKTDPGILAPLFLNVYTLSPGEALYQGAGELHAYVEGAGIELMANSDNVLRGGLTPKYIDVDELLKVLSFRFTERKIIEPLESSAGVFEYPAPSEEFSLRSVVIENAESVQIDNSLSLEILICISGCAEIISDEAGITIRKGESLLIPASVESYLIKGPCTLYSAAIPDGRS